MNWYDLLWDGIKAAVHVAWPDVQPGNLWNDVQAQKRDWTNLLDSQQMAPPWVVCALDPQPTTEWGTGAPRFAVGVTIYYIAADNANTGGKKLVNFVMGKAIDLQAAILASADVGTILPELKVNANAENPVDTSLIDSDQRFTASSLTFTTIVVSGDYT